MNYKEKAKELMELFWAEVRDSDYESRRTLENKQAKKMALKAVDEVLKAVSINQVLYLTDMTYQIHSDYTKIKQELEKL
jgi:hypothetical protein